jgi:hypothetical protein
VNAVVLWNSTYLSAIVDHLRAQGWKSTDGTGVTDQDVARLSPLGHAHLNCLGRYAITPSGPSQGLRPLRPAARTTAVRTDRGTDRAADQVEGSDQHPHNDRL